MFATCELAKRFLGKALYILSPLHVVCLENVRSVEVAVDPFDILGVPVTAHAGVFIHAKSNLLRNFFPLGYYDTYTSAPMMR